MPLNDDQEMQLVRDVAEVKGMLVGNLGELRRIADQHDQRLGSHSAALGGLSERMARVEGLATDTAQRLADAADTGRANAALILASIAGLVGLGGLAVQIVNATT